MRPASLIHYPFLAIKSLFGAMMPDRALDEDSYHALAAYTLTRGDVTFIHQHVVDAYAVQHADARSKPIAVAFALIGLYLHLEKQYTGRQVQRAHMTLARTRRQWPSFDLPADRGAMTARDVMAAGEGADRDAAIHAWCASIWKACHGSRERVVELLREHQIA